MALETMTKLASTTVGAGGSATIAFSNIPQGYTDLKVLLSTRESGATVYDSIYVTFNGIGGTAYSTRWLEGTGSITQSSSSTAAAATGFYITTGASATANVFSNVEVHISKYSGSTYKSISADSVGEDSGSTSYQRIVAGLFSNSSPITSMSFTAGTGNFVQFSTATLYGVKNAAKTASNSIKATGGNIVFDGTYVYHVFNATGTFTPTQSLTADALIVAGGGGGGYGSGGGGGGAGGVVYATNQSLSYSTSYAVTIGGGGTGGIDNSSTISTSGSNSAFSSLIAIGGGFGGNEGNGFPSRSIGGTGGSGGGGGDGANNGTPPQSYYAGAAATQTSGTGYTGYGNAGGNANYGGGQYAGGGGGGAGGAGATSSTGAGVGGVGTSAFSALLSAVSHGVNVSGVRYIAGGGAGAYQNDSSNTNPGIAQGGYGGGGNGGMDLATNSNNTIATDGLAYTGGGGGGGTNGWASGGAGTATSPTSHSGIGGAGGSGLVIVRYKG